MKKHTQKISIILVIFSLLSVAAFAQTRLPASPIRTVYITPTSHYDFGFVEPPDKVRERAARHIDEVIRVAESDPDFRWTIESVWQVNEWLKRAIKPTSVLPKDKEKIARLMNLIKSGRVALSTSWGSMHTDFMGAEELNRINYDFAKLRRTYGIDSELALMDDVPGHPTSIPSVLAGGGTKYLVTGANIFIGVATSLAPGKVPFYWESPDGGKVLTWVSQSPRGGYTEGLTDFYLDPFTLDPYTDKTPFDMFNPEQAGKKTPLEVMEIGVTELLNRYNKAGYKYDAVMAMYAHDFVEPTNVANLEKAVKLWNASHSEVKLKIATPTEFFKYIQSKYGSEIPTYRGEWSGLWSESKTQSPKISALARYAHDHAPAAEMLWSAVSMQRNIPYPVGNFSTLYDLMFTYDEHSGAGNNGWIQLNSREPLEEQNREYVRDMLKATHENEFMLDQGISMIAQPSRYDIPPPQKSENTRNVVVFNGLSWPRNDVVKLTNCESPRVSNGETSNVENSALANGQAFASLCAGSHITQIRDLSDNSTAVFDTDEYGNAIFVAKNIPAFGYKTYEVTTAPGKAVSTLIELRSDTASNANFQIKMRPDGSVQSIFDKRANREIVNGKGELPFNDLLRVEGQEASKVAYPIAPKISVKKGKQMSQIVVRRDRSLYPLTTLTIYDGINRVDLHNELDGSKMPFVGGNNNWNDSYYFAFPFNVSKNALKVKRGGQKWFDTLPDDYLPDARHDAVTTQHLFGFTDGKASAYLAHRQAFHWVYPGFVSTKMRAKDAPKELPPMFTGKFPLPEATIYSRAVRRSNQADTHDLGVINMESVEPGLDGNYVFDYAIAGGGAFDDVAAWKMGSNFDLPLIARYVTVPPLKTSDSFFSVDAPNVQITTVKTISDEVVRGEVSASPLDPQINKIYIVRLHEFSGKPAAARVTLPVKIRSAAIMNLTEEKILAPVSEIAPLTVNLKPFETLTIRIEIE